MEWQEDWEDLTMQAKQKQAAAQSLNLGEWQICQSLSPKNGEGLDFKQTHCE